MKPELTQQIQRFADGELSPDDQDDLFLQLDVSDGDEWRSLALAMIEHGEIKHSLQTQPAKQRSALLSITLTSIAAAVALFLGIGIGQISQREGELTTPLVSETDSTPSAKFVPVNFGHDVTVRSILVRANDENGNLRLYPFRELEIRPAL